MPLKEVELISHRLLLQKALVQTAEKTVGLQPLVTQLSKAVHQASMEPAGDHAQTGWP